MPQDHLTGSEAAKWGWATGRRIGVALKATALSKKANEFLLGERRIAIKTARATTNSVGVTYSALDRIDDVYGAWESEAGVFEVWALPSDVFKTRMRPTASKGIGAGKVGLVRLAVFKETGRHIATVRI